MTATPIETIKQSLLDRLIGYVDPVAALRRHQARALMAVAGGYDGASTARRASSQWQVRDLSANAAIVGDLPMLRARSRDLTRNVPLAAGAIATVVTNTVGTGLKLRAQIDREALGLDETEADQWERAAEREWRLWAESEECDLGRSARFETVQDLVLRSTLEGGDCFTVKRFVERAGSPFGLKLQTIEGDRVSNPNRIRDTAALVGGVALDQTGAPTGYWITDRHPGDMLGGIISWSLLPAFGERSGQRNVLHHFRPTRPEQRRGVPYLAPVIETLKQLGRYSDAEIMAAVINSCFAIGTKTDAGVGLGLEQSATKDAKGDAINITESGQIFNLLPNEAVESFTPGRPSPAFDPFVEAMLRQVGVALELPFEVLVKHFTASYSAARAALIQAWLFFMVRRHWLAQSLCQPVYEALITEAVARGRLAAPGFFRDPARRAAWCGAQWVGPAPPQIDPLKEAEAAALMVKNSWKTDAEVTAELTGGDWERKIGQRAKEARIKRELGLDIEGVAERIRTEPQPQGPAPQPPPNDDQLEQADQT